MPVRFLLEFAYFSRWFNFYGPQNRTPLFCLHTANSVGLARLTPIRYKYTKDVIGHRRSLCGLASQGSHYPYPNPFRGSNPFWSVLLLQITLDLLLHRPRKSLIDPAEKRWAPKRSSSARRRIVSFRVLQEIPCNLSMAFPELYSVNYISPSHDISRVNASRKYALNARLKNL